TRHPCLKCIPLPHCWDGHGAYVPPTPATASPGIDSKELLMREFCLFVPLAFVGASAARAITQNGGPSPLPQPAFHHIHINSVDPDKSLAWYSQYWPKGKKTTFGGFPAFVDERGFYLLYTKVSRQAPGAFDRSAQRSVPQS